MTNTIPTLQIPVQSENEDRYMAYSRVLSRLPRYITRSIVYIGQVGESMKNVFPFIVRPLYALSISYILVDITMKSYYAQHKSWNYRKHLLMDLSLWHLGASLVFPAILVKNSIRFMTFGLNKYNFGKRTCTYLPAVVTLSLLPFIIDPIDLATDKLMDHTYRKHYNFKNFENEIEDDVFQHHATEEERNEIIEHKEEEK